MEWVVLHIEEDETGIVCDECRADLNGEDCFESGDTILCLECIAKRLSKAEAILNQSGETIETK